MRRTRYLYSFLIMYILNPICKGTGISNKTSNDLEKKPSVHVLHRKKQSQFIEFLLLSTGCDIMDLCNINISEVECLFL